MMCHALIIEDDYLVADYVAALAEIAGATSSEIAQTEVAALEAARKRRPDIILCDVRLEAGCGRAAVAKIEAEIGSVSVLYVTGEPEACEQGDGILAKPFHRDAFLDAFRKHASVSVPAGSISGQHAVMVSPLKSSTAVESSPDDRRPDRPTD
jgi:DNA-binding response OmpR family regulator